LTNGRPQASARVFHTEPFAEGRGRLWGAPMDPLTGLLYHVRDLARGTRVGECPDHRPTSKFPAE
jgi:hypothetical protein